MKPSLGALRFPGGDYWPGRDPFRRALELAPSGFERGELAAMKDLAEAGRLVRREIPGVGGSIRVEKSAVSIRGITSEEQRIVEIAASSSDKDRYGDIIEPSGWMMEEYEINPVVLYDHWYSVEGIVGHALAWWVDGKNFMMRHRIDPAGTNAAADMVWGKLVNRSLRANSVGFKPIAWEKILDEEGNWTGGFIFKKQKLLEDSYVAVPANPYATIGLGPEPSTSRELQEPAHQQLVAINEALDLALLAGRL